MSNAKQDQRSEESMSNPAGKPGRSGPQADQSAGSTGSGIGASQAQDREKRRDDDVPRTAPGTADIERSTGGAQERSDSLSDDPVGAYKERP
jgi:hypothetical protein